MAMTKSCYGYQFHPQKNTIPPEKPTTTPIKLSDPAISFAGFELRLSSWAILLMLIAILVPAIVYNFHLRDPTPAQLLVGICIAIFSSTICLWILDAISMMRFRSPWVSHSVWVTAIASILGTSVGVYQGAFAERKHPYEGAWNFTALAKDSDSPIAENVIVIIHSESADTYWGYSDFTPSPDASPKKAVSVEIMDFVPQGDDASITAKLFFKDAQDVFIQGRLNKDRQGKRFTSDKSDSKYDLTLVRPR
jgi:hypothetical protein